MERQEKAPVPEAHQKTSTTIVENSIDLIEPDGVHLKAPMTAKRKDLPPKELRSSEYAF